MNIKELIQSGCVISFSYKDDRKQYVHEAKIYSNAPVFGMKPYIYVDIYCVDLKIGNQKFEPHQIDEAIDLYVKCVFRKENLMYKFQEAVMILYNEGYTLLDPEIDEHLQLIMNKREELFNV